MNEFHQRLRTELLKGRWDRRYRHAKCMVHLHDSSYAANDTLGFIVTAIYIPNEITSMSIMIDRRTIRWIEQEDTLDNVDSLQIILETSRNTDLDDNLDQYKRIIPVCPFVYMTKTSVLTSEYIDDGYYIEYYRVSMSDLDIPTEDNVVYPQVDTWACDSSDLDTSRRIAQIDMCNRRIYQKLLIEDRQLCLALNGQTNDVIHDQRYYELFETVE